MATKVKAKKSSPQPQKPLVEILADLAEKNGLWARNLSPYLLQEAGITPEQVNPSLLHQADSFNKLALESLVEKWNREGPWNTILQN